MPRSILEIFINKRGVSVACGDEIYYVHMHMHFSKNNERGVRGMELHDWPAAGEFFFTPYCILEQNYTTFISYNVVETKLLAKF
jgi:hypothetical protein